MLPRCHRTRQKSEKGTLVQLKVSPPAACSFSGPTSSLRRSLLIASHLRPQVQNCPFVSIIKLHISFTSFFLFHIIDLSSSEKPSSVFLGYPLPLNRQPIMYHKRVACGLMAAMAAFASAADSDVHQLTQDNFDEFVKTNNLVLAECELPFPILCISRRHPRLRELDLD